MKLAVYLSQQRGRTAQVACRIGKAPAFVSQMASGARSVAPATAIALELATDYEVRVWDVRPDDWWRIWPHLEGTAGAPAPHATTTPAQQGVCDAA